MTGVKPVLQADTETSEVAVREAKAGLDRLRELADELDSKDTSLAKQLREVEESLERNVAYLIEVSLIRVDDLTQQEVDLLAEREISARVAKGPSKGPLTAAEVFGKYGLVDPAG